MFHHRVIRACISFAVAAGMVAAIAATGEKRAAPGVSCAALPTGDHHRSGLSRMYDEPAWYSFAKGVDLLEKGVPRAVVLAQWEQTLRLYPRSRYTHQLQTYVTVLREQVAEDTRLPRLSLQNPAALPPTRRIQYYLAQLPDVHGYQASQPGICWTTGAPASHALIQIGRAALPALIDHLQDRRLTRSVGFWRNFDPNRTVLRVQDVAYQCIRQISGIDFLAHRNAGDYLSTAPVPLRERVVRDINAWWKRSSAIHHVSAHSSAVAVVLAE